MILCTTDFVPNKEILEYKGLVKGATEMIAYGTAVVIKESN